MCKQRNDITYRLLSDGEEKPITREQLESYDDLSKFFVTSNGLVLPITASTDHKILINISGGRYMYKDELEDIVFTS